MSTNLSLADGLALLLLVLDDDSGRHARLAERLRNQAGREAGADLRGAPVLARALAAGTAQPGSLPPAAAAVRGFLERCDLRPALAEFEGRRRERSARGEDGTRARSRGQSRS